MKEPLDSLKAVLADRYTMELELGSGGMATEYLAHDLTMPYVEGESLREGLNRKKELSKDEALKITNQVAGALSYAQSREAPTHWAATPIAPFLPACPATLDAQ